MLLVCVPSAPSLPLRNVVLKISSGWLFEDNDCKKRTENFRMNSIGSCVIVRLYQTFTCITHRDRAATGFYSPRYVWRIQTILCLFLFPSKGKANVVHQRVVN